MNNNNFIVKIIEYILTFIIVFCTISFLTIYYIFNFKKENKLTMMFKEFEFKYLFKIHVGKFLFNKLKNKIKSIIK